MVEQKFPFSNKREMGVRSFLKACACNSRTSAGAPASTDNTLYVILPYFNYCGFKRRRALFLEFIERIRNTPGIRIIVSETFDDPVNALPNKIPGVYAHHVFKTKHRIWLKENLINLATDYLPGTWKYMAWVDADLTFVNGNWAADTVAALRRYDFVQMFQSAINMGANGETIKVDQSFGYMYLMSGRPYTKTYKYGFWHPGYAWACTRRAFETTAGLIDFGICGSGDHHMALALIGKVNQSHPGGIHEGYARLLQRWQKRAEKLTLGYVNGTILHHYHGTLANRRYRERWDILTKGAYDPITDIGFNNQRLIQFTYRGERLADDISDYFGERQEDS